MTNPYYFSAHWRRLRAAALRRDGGCCAVPGCIAPAAIVDHIVSRPRGVVVPCPEDRLDNLRSLCTTHDLQIKEDRNGKRRRGGRPVLKGCDIDGWPLSCATKGSGLAIMKALAAIAAALALTACAEMHLSQVTDPRTGFTFTGVKSACEATGGPRQDVIIVTDPSGAIRHSFSGSGPCTLQSAIDALAGAVPLAAGMMGGAAMLRPATSDDR